MTSSTGLTSCGARALRAAALLARRRAHFGGQSVDGTIQAMFARRQLEHGNCLSQRTLRLRHTTQLRSFDAGVDEVLADASEVAVFSELEAEAAIATVTADTGDMLRSSHGRSYQPGRFMVTFSSRLTRAFLAAA